MSDVVIGTITAKFLDNEEVEIAVEGKVSVMSAVALKGMLDDIIRESIDEQFKEQVDDYH